jgi:hypothetical protein
MGEYTRRIDIDRPATEVFAFIADTRHMPAFLPTVRTVTPQGAGRVVVEGASNGRHYRNDGWLRADPGAMVMEWGSAAATGYRGSLRVVPRGTEGDDARRAQIEVRLHLNPAPAQARRPRTRFGDPDQAAQEGIDTALVAIKSLCEGTGVARRPTTAERRSAAAAAALAADDAVRGAAPAPEGRAGEADYDDVGRRRRDDSRPYGHSATMNPPDIA